MESHNKGDRRPEGAFPRLVGDDKKPSLEDLSERMRLDREEIERIGRLASSVERDQAKLGKEFDAMVTDGGLARRASQSWIAKLWWLGTAALFFGVLGFGIGMNAMSKATTAKTEVAMVKTDLVGFRKEIKAKFDTTTAELEAVKGQIKVVGLNADLNLAGLEKKIGLVNDQQEVRISDNSTNLMSKANLDNVKDVAGRIRRTNKKMSKLEEQIMELKAQLQAQLPKTM